MIRLLSILLLLAAAASADACNRCGRYGSYCRFAYVPTVYTPPNNTNNFIFNNPFAAPAMSLPTALLSTGHTVYGSALTVSSSPQSYSMSAQPLFTSPEQYADRAFRLTQIGYDSANRGRDMFNEAGALAMRLEADRQRDNNATAVTLAYLNSKQPPSALTTGASQVLKITIGPDGQPSASFIGGAACQNGNCVPQQPGQTPPLPSPVLDLSICARCHDGRGTNGTPQGSVIDANTPIDFQRYLKLSARVMNGDMPPNSNLTTEQKVAIVGKLHGLIPAASER